jgi:hypothetical protein
MILPRWLLIGSAIFWAGVAYAAGWLPLASSPAGCSQSAAFLSRVAAQDASHTAAYQVLICGLVTDGVWPKFDAFYILAANESATALTNLVGSSYPLTVNGSPTFSANAGYTGAASAYLDTGFVPLTAGGLYQQNDSSQWAWQLTDNLSDTGGILGENRDSSLTSAYIYPRFTDTNYYWRDQRVADSQVVNPGTSAGFYGWSRDTSTTAQAYRNATKLKDDATTSSALSAFDIVLLYDGTGAGGTPAQGVVSFGAFGAHLTGAQEANLYARVHTYMQTIAGAP